MTTQAQQHVRKDLNAKGMNIAIVVSRFNETVTGRLLTGAVQCFERHGLSTKKISIYICPGAFELPQVANAIARQQRVDAIVCLGAVVKGETPHFEYVAGAAALGVQQVALQHGRPVVFGVLTTKTLRQAMERSGGKRGNKGWSAALTAIEMVSLFKQLKRSAR